MPRYDTSKSSKSDKIMVKLTLNELIRDVFWFQEMLKSKIDLFSLEQLYQPNQIYTFKSESEKIKRLYNYRNALVDEMMKVYQKWLKNGY